MGAKNLVIGCDYIGKGVASLNGVPHILISSFSFKDSIMLDRFTVNSYEVITDEHTKSAASGAVRGLVGGALLGPVGLLAGALSAKNKGIYIVAISFKDGKKSLLEVDDKIYKSIVTNCYEFSNETSYNTENKFDQLLRLAELKEKGVLSEEEFQNEKAKIMNV